jgi:hypothetical protein
MIMILSSMWLVFDIVFCAVLWGMKQISTRISSLSLGGSAFVIALHSYKMATRLAYPPFGAGRMSKNGVAYSGKRVRTT